MLATVRVDERVERCVLFFLKNLMPGIWILGIFFVGGGGLGWWQVLLETWRKLAALPFFSLAKIKARHLQGGWRAESSIDRFY